MERIIHSYWFPFEEFRAFVADHSMIVTGFAALKGYLLQNTIELASMKDSMDIWTYYEEERQRHGQGREQDDHVVWGDGVMVEEDDDHDSNDHMVWFLLFLREYGYIIQGDVEHPSQPTPFHKKTTMVHESGPMITIYEVSPTKGPLLPLLHQYESTSITSWWDSHTDYFMTEYETSTLMKQVFIKGRWQQEAAMRHPSSLEKLDDLVYCGFTVIEEPCIALNQPDGRELLDTMDPFEGLTAFDLMAYEDVGCCDHLRASVWNVLVCVGNVFHAYDRRVLYQMMREKEYILQGHCFVTSPHQQTMTQRVLHYLCTSDHSVIEWVHAYDVSEQSIYDVNFYTVDQWRHRTPGRVVLSPWVTDNRQRLGVDHGAMGEQRIRDGYRTIEEMIQYERMIMAQLVEDLQNRIT